MSTSPQTPQLSMTRPGDPEWDRARQAWNLAADQHPDAVVEVASADDVVAAIAHAREAGLRVAVQGTGHGATARGPLTGTLLIRTDQMTGLSIDPGRRIARAEAGVLAGDVSAVAAEHGLVALGGSSPDVGVVGYTLGGGIGWLARLHGFAADAVTAVEVVTADCEQRRVDADNDPDLFWALKGGGGAFAVVTAIEFELFPLTEAFGGAIGWPGEQAVAVLARYDDWAAGLSDEWTTSVRFRYLPDVPFVPEPLRGRHTIAVDAVFAGDPAEGERQLGPLLAGEPIENTFRRLTPGELIRVHGDPEQPVPSVGDHTMLRELGADTIHALVEAAGSRSGTPLLAVELRQLGGALTHRKDDQDPGPAQANGAYTLYALGSPMARGTVAEIRAHLGKVLAAVRPWSTGGTYLNFDDAGPADPARSFDEATYARLRLVKAKYDADDLIVSNHPIPPA